MSQTIDVNGQSINYPETGDTNWGDEATDFAVQTSAAFGKLGLASGTSVDIAQTLDVTGDTTLDANLSVAGTTSLAGNVTLTNNLTVNGNTTLGDASGDTTTITGIVNIDSGVLYVDPVNNRVGINDTTPSEALDVTGNVAITGNEAVGGTLGITGDVSVNTNKFNITASSGNTSIAGTLEVSGDVAINTNKFNVTASSGNTTIAGTLGVTGNTTLTGTLLNSNGTALLPSISFSSDPDNGMYYIGSNNYGLSVGGSKVSDISSLGLINGTAGTEFRNVLQIVTNGFTTGTSRTSNTFGDFATAFNQAITVKSTSSRIIIMCSIGGLGFNTAGNLIFVTLAANGTIVPDGNSDGGLAGGQPGSTSQIISCNITYSHLHGLSVGTSITYSVYGRATAGAIWLNRSSTGSYPSASTLMLMEVI